MKASSPVSGSEVEPHLRRISSRRDEVGSAERRQEVVKRDFVGQVDDRKAQAPPVMILSEQVFVSQAGIKEVAGCNSRGIVVVVFCPGRGYL